MLNDDIWVLVMHVPSMDNCLGGMTEFELQIVDTADSQEEAENKLELYNKHNLDNKNRIRITKTKRRKQNAQTEKTNS